MGKQRSSWLDPLCWYGGTTERMFRCRFQFLRVLFLRFCWFCSVLAFCVVCFRWSGMWITQTKHILDNILHLNHTDTQIKSELLAITQQIYFRHNNITVTQTDGLAMDAPSSSTISEIFLQHIKHTHLPHQTQKQTHKLLPVC